MLTKRTLMKWRREALESLAQLHKTDSSTTPHRFEGQRLIIEEPNKRILRLTQELLDQHLMKGK